ncbi:MAG: TonB-dependent receptor [Ponticaulis sp.]|nr:TonB-dependent receptor [Ponticaulis sp.]
MNNELFLRKLLGSCGLAAFLPVVMGMPALAQETDDPVEITTPAETEAVQNRVYVTGSRIQRDVSSTSAPVVSLGEQIFEDRGLVSAADALNEITSLAPVRNQAAGNGGASGDGQQYPELFGLGAGRTLTLVNGKRFVTTAQGLEDSRVDANIISSGLIEKIEIVQGGGAAVYGSDAIAGVVNYILKDDFEGVEFDVQYGNTALSNYEQTAFRLTAGKNFANDRGNIAVNVETSKTPLVYFSDFEASNRSRVTQSNPLDTGPTDGIPSVSEVMPAHMWGFNYDGVIFNIPAPPPFALTSVNGAPATFDADGNIVAYNPGQILGIPFAVGGDGVRYSDLVPGLRSGVERVTGNALFHYDFSPNLRWNAELLYAETEGTSIGTQYSRTALNQQSPSIGAIMFLINNPFLTDANRGALISANPGFAQGQPLWLSRIFSGDLVPSPENTYTTETVRFMTGLEGDFDAAGRNFYWSASASYAEVDGEQRGWDVDFAKFNNATFAFGSPTNPVCYINIDGDPTNDDPNCAPLNPFGYGNASQAARDYVSVMAGNDYKNTQFDFLATIGTELFTMPAGPVDVVLAYEHRKEEAEFTPLEANQLGIVGTGSVEVPSSGSYDTNELSAEFLLPLIGGDFTMPFAQELEISGSYRYVDNSLVGEEDVWGIGARFMPFDGLTLRANRSRNFRAPNLNQLFAPTSTSFGAIGVDPCDADRIDAGPNPAVRRANCEAEWAANPGYAPLATFQDFAENTPIAVVTSGGNPDLVNEVSDTTTFGFVIDDLFIDGLTISVDRIDIDLTNGISNFTTQDFLAACYDDPSPQASVCNAFARIPVSDGTNPGGSVLTGRSTTFNAGEVTFKGEVYFASYDFDLSRIYSGTDASLNFAVEATHMAELSTSVTGTTFNRTDNTTAQPDWTGRFNLSYMNGPARVSYQLNYLDDVKASEAATIENNPNPLIDSNITHDITFLYEVTENATIRIGARNFTDELPSYPTLTHGDILGRRYFAGLNLRF